MTSGAAARSAATAGLEDVLSGGLGVRALRSLLAEPLDGLAPAWDGAPGLVRSKYKPGRRLTGYYRWGNRAPRLAARTWYADGRTSVLVSPADPAMPQLTRLCDPTRLARLLAMATGAAVCRSPHELTVKAIRYRPGERHVLHVRGGLLAPAGLYLKLDRDASGARAVPVAAKLAHHLAVAEPVGYVGADRVAVWHGAPGRSLGPLLRDGSPGGARLVHRVGQELRALHDSPVRVDRWRSIATEAESTLRAGEHIATLLPQEGDLVRALVEKTVAALDRRPVETRTLTHGDVKCDNLLVHGEQQIRFLDLDRVAIAEPALDLGKFLADLRWWCPESRLPALRSALRAGYGQCDPVRWARADLLAVLLGAKLVARRCAIHDPAWEATVPVRLAGLAGALEAVGVRR